jgi:hypothetical protein
LRSSVFLTNKIVREEQKTGIVDSSTSAAGTPFSPEEEDDIEDALA